MMKWFWEKTTLINYAFMPLEYYDFYSYVLLMINGSIQYVSLSKSETLNKKL